ncbi:hypothetical protein A1O3_08310 [Capronia epimyces CBS 606.96]|uniref:Uncharacterized protein n=1 Tax=Capronia epimyces CBS 606.96 TaxID=1182542 RepID=W9YCG1_9EURO|nr:uncharacterized protein A1O3_08310 [Capronia epimyces CBS 606.96]EXJ80024.1 hypothetical protein A1O3_08310 [Capronia epimyces CBS 606.96]
MEKNAEHASLMGDGGAVDAEDAVIDMDSVRDEPGGLASSIKPPLRSQPQPTTTTGVQMRWLLSWRFLHPLAWFIVFCVTGPLMVHLLFALKINRLLYDIDMSLDLEDLAACDVQEVWSSWSTLFQINVRTGDLSFTAAKIVDIAFDLVVGRVGQVVLGWMSYRVYTDVFTFLAERQPVPYPTFTKITVDPTSLSSLKTYLLALFSKNGSKLTLLWLIGTVSYLLALPTIVSASTSLVGATAYAIELPTNATVPVLEYLYSAAYKFTNSGLADKPNPWFVYVSEIHKLPAKVSEEHLDIMYLDGTNWSGTDRNDVLVVNSTTYTISNSTLVDAGFYYDDVFYPIDPAKNHGFSTLVGDQMICVPVGNRYQWGASYELLCLIVICQILWSAAMLVAWSIACMSSATIQSGRKMGLYTAILLLAQPLREKMNARPAGNGNDDVNNEKVVKSIVKTIGPVVYDGGFETSDQEGEAGKTRGYARLREHI